MNVYEMPSIKALFADTLAEKPDSYIIEEIFARFTSLSELMNVSEQELLAIKGIGRSKARQIIASLQLARKLNAPTYCTPYIIRTPKDAADLLMPEMRYLQQEKFICLYLNTKNHVIGQPETFSIGSLNAAIVTPYMVFRAAVKRSAASLLCVHNHPSGDPTVSPEDIQLTKRLVDSGNIVGVEVLDHLILGDGNYVSMKERGLM